MYSLGVVQWPGFLRCILMASLSSRISSLHIPHLCWITWNYRHGWIVIFNNTFELIITSSSCTLYTDLYSKMVMLWVYLAMHRISSWSAQTYIFRLLWLWFIFIQWLIKNYYKTSDPHAQPSVTFHPWEGVVILAKLTTDSHKVCYVVAQPALQIHLDSWNPF